MANHKQHITFSTVSGLLFGGLAWYPCGFPAVTCLLSGGLCSVGGMLPDIDIKTSRSFQDCMSITACIAAMLMIIRVNATGIGSEMVAIIGTVVFVAVKFGVGGLTRAFTVHRGLIHSIPFGILCGEIMFLLTPGDMSSRILKAAGLTLGFFSHLLLDEIYSVKVTQGKVSTKKSFGTALKLGQLKNMPLTIVLYFLLVGATYLSFQQPALVGGAFDKALDNLAGLTIRGAQHFEDVSHKAQQHLRENTNLYYARSDEPPQNDVDLPGESQLAQNGTLQTDAGQRASQYDMPPMLMPAENPLAVDPQAVKTTSNAVTPTAQLVATDSQRQLTRPPLLGEIRQQTQSHPTTTASTGTTQPTSRPSLLGEMTRQTPQHSSSALSPGYLLPSAAPIQ